MTEPTELDSALPSHPQRRDALGHVCFVLHFAIMIYIVTGWLAPWRALLGFYLVFIPVVYLQWQVNKDTCVLNNIEGWLRTGRWRNKDVNPEEGAWLLTLANNLTGRDITAFQINILTYCVLALVWLLAVARMFAIL